MWKQLRIPIAKAARAIKTNMEDDAVQVNGLGTSNIFAGEQVDDCGREHHSRMVITATTRESVQKRRLAKSQTSSLDFSRI